MFDSRLSELGCRRRQGEIQRPVKFTPLKGSFNKARCSACGEYVFERYLRSKDGQPICIPCSGY